jgi:hypothetical protein
MDDIEKHFKKQREAGVDEYGNGKIDVWNHSGKHEVKLLRMLGGSPEKSRNKNGAPVSLTADNVDSLRYRFDPRQNLDDFKPFKVP